MKKFDKTSIISLVLGILALGAAVGISFIPLPEAITEKAVLKNLWLANKVIFGAGLLFAVIWSLIKPRGPKPTYMIVLLSVLLQGIAPLCRVAGSMPHFDIGFCALFMGLGIVAWGVTFALSQYWFEMGAHNNKYESKRIPVAEEKTILGEDGK